MIYIFHGDNTLESRQALNLQLDQLKDTDILRLDPKEANLVQINLFLNSTSLIPLTKVIVINNFFSITKANLDKIIKIFQKASSGIFLWSDKNLTPTQLKTFPQASVRQFKNEAYLFSCIYAIKPGNFLKFNHYFQKIVANDEIELFTYLLRQNFRKTLLVNPSNFPLKSAYLQLIELDYQMKTGALATPKNIALSRIIFNLMS